LATSDPIKVANADRMGHIAGEHCPSRPDNIPICVCDATQTDKIGPNGSPS
jgi:hypothetical protein